MRMLAFVAAALVVAQEEVKPQKEHEWLRQLVGEWEAEMQAGDPPTTVLKATESGRMIGGFWAQLETKGDLQGKPFTGLLSLGYDPARKKYVGTWIDSTSSHLWRYEGTLDEAGKVLTLETEGPTPGAPEKISKYREIIEVKDKDQKVFRSLVEADGKWVTFLTARYARKK